MKRVFLNALVLLIVSLIPAQSSIQFKKTEHDYGTLKEEQGKASYDFIFTNVSKKPIKLQNVQASCGCTTPTWTKEEVKPGKTGKITAEYETTGRPGPFDKSITVTVEGDPNPIVLKIKGNVTPRPKGIKDYYPVESGNLRFNNNSIYIEKLYQNERAERTVKVYNQGEKTITFQEGSKVLLPKHLTLELEKMELKPKDSMKITVGFNAALQNELDNVFNSVQLVTDDEKDPTKIIYVTANVVENFDNVDKTNAPVASFDRTTHDFGVVPQRAENKTTFKLTNTGKSDLIIRQSKASCGCTVGKPQKEVLKPGESTDFEVNFSTIGKPEGDQTQVVTIITNDPNNPKTQLFVKANVKKEQK